MDLFLFISTCQLVNNITRVSKKKRDCVHKKMRSDVGVRWWKHSTIFGTRNYNVDVKNNYYLVLLLYEMVIVYEKPKNKKVKWD